MTYPLLVS